MGLLGGCKKCEVCNLLNVKILQISSVSYSLENSSENHKHRALWCNTKTDLCV